MEGLAEKLIIGFASSLITAIIIFVFSQGIKLSKKSRERIKQERKQEVELWKSKEFGVRQRITNEYLFAILKFLFLANICFAMSGAWPVIVAFNLTYELNIILFSILSVLALSFFLAGLAKIIRYIKLRKLDKEP